MTDPVKKDVTAWVDASRYDLKTARALLNSRRYIYVLFMCQQALEKLFKANVMARTGEFPPRVHNLARLAELASVELSAEEKVLVERLSLYYLQSRYPPEIQALVRHVGRSMAQAHLERTEALWRKLKRRLARKS